MRQNKRLHKFAQPYVARQAVRYEAKPAMSVTSYKYFGTRPHDHGRRGIKDATMEGGR
jgi:hypothetical protein